MFESGQITLDELNSELKQKPLEVSNNFVDTYFNTYNEIQESIKHYFTGNK